MNGNPAIPMLAVNDGNAALRYYKNVFGAVEVIKMVTEEGKVEHSELTIEEARIMVADEFPEHNHSAKSLGGSSHKFNAGSRVDPKIGPPA